MNIDKLNNTARTIAKKMHEEFPDLPPEMVRYFARFAASSAHCVAEVEKTGVSPSEKGYELIFETCAEVSR